MQKKWGRPDLLSKIGVVETTKVQVTLKMRLIVMDLVVFIHDI